MKSRFSAGIVLTPCLLLLAACNVVPPPQGDATRFYLLSNPAISTGRGTAEQRGLRLGLRGVEVADYLRTRSMVVRRGSNELSLDEFNRWAEPLDAGIARVLRTTLAAAPAIGRVVVQPFPLDSDRDYDVNVTVLRCEGAESGGNRGTARFSALVEITSAGPDPHVVARLNYSAPDLPWDGHDFGRLAEDLSQAVSGLAREIISALPASPVAPP